MYLYTTVESVDEELRPTVETPFGIGVLMVRFQLPATMPRHCHQSHDSNSPHVAVRWLSLRSLVMRTVCMSSSWTLVLPTSKPGAVCRGAAIHLYLLPPLYCASLHLPSSVIASAVHIHKRASDQRACERALEGVNLFLEYSRACPSVHHTVPTIPLLSHASTHTHTLAHHAAIASKRPRTFSQRSATGCPCLHWVTPP